MYEKQNCLRHVSLAFTDRSFSLAILLPTEDAISSMPVAPNAVNYTWVDVTASALAAATCSGVAVAMRGAPGGVVFFLWGHW